MAASFEKPFRRASASALAACATVSLTVARLRFAALGGVSCAREVGGGAGGGGAATVLARGRSVRPSRNHPPNEDGASIRIVNAASWLRRGHTGHPAADPEMCTWLQGEMATPAACAQARALPFLPAEAHLVPRRHDREPATALRHFAGDDGDCGRPQWCGKKVLRLRAGGESNIAHGARRMRQALRTCSATQYRCACFQEVSTDTTEPPGGASSVGGKRGKGKCFTCPSRAWRRGWRTAPRAAWHGSWRGSACGGTPVAWPPAAGGTPPPPGRNGRDAAQDAPSRASPLRVHLLAAHAPRCRPLHRHRGNRTVARRGVGVARAVGIFLAWGGAGAARAWRGHVLLPQARTTPRCPSTAAAASPFLQ
eukprot:gene5664-biopygen2765